jgi:phytoene synthase
MQLSTPQFSTRPYPPRPFSATVDEHTVPTLSSDSGGPVDDAKALRTLMQGGSKTFFVASLLLPPRVRAPATALYAFCRLADDAIDDGVDKPGAYRDLQRRLDAIYAGRPEPVDADRALLPVVRQYGIPRELLDGLLEGFFWDAEGRRYETLADVQAYGARVAGTVGAMMALIMETRSAEALARACELGVAMQLTNIARDVGEDAREGRLYLPLQWLREAGIDPESWLRNPVFNDAIASVIERLLKAADDLYHRAEAGIAALPRDCRPAIRSAQLVYAEIGEEVRRHGFDSISRRAVVSGRRKLMLISRASSVYLISPRAADKVAGPLPAIAFLVDAAADTLNGLPPARVAGKARRRSFDEKVVWATDLFERLSEQDRLAR